jgi:hypothetical protein
MWRALHNFATYNTQQGEDNMKTNKLIWIPRALSIVFIVFLALFALDVFSGEVPLVKKLGGFFIHLIPSFTLVIILVISWKKPFIGGSLFILLSIVFILVFRTYRPLPTLLFLTSPTALVGILFVILTRKKTQARDVADS